MNANEILQATAMVNFNQLKEIFELITRKILEWSGNPIDGLEVW